VALGIATRCKPSSAKWRCKVRSEGTTMFGLASRIIRFTCAAVRPRFSFFKATAIANEAAGNRDVTCLGDGTSASNPPRRQSLTQRSNVDREIWDICPSGARWGVDAIWRISSPRCFALKLGSAASRINPYRNNPISLARSLRAFSLSLTNFSGLSSTCVARKFAPT